MGKAEILANLTEGKYRVRIKYDRRWIEDSINLLNAKISELEGKISDPEYPEGRKGALKLQILSYKKRLTYFETWTPVEPELSVWCADYSKEIPTGTLIGTSETFEDGEDEMTGRFQLLPYFENVDDKEGDSEFDPAEHGQLQPAIAAKETGAAVFYNWAMRPGRIKWRPAYRYGTLTDIDKTADTCDLVLTPAHVKTVDPLISGNVNPSEYTSLSDVPIVYMDCDSKPFEVGDEVLIKFKDNDWNQPEVIGFHHEPKPCRVAYICIRFGEYCIVWDVLNRGLVDPLTEGILGFEWPMEYRFVSNWLSQFNQPDDVPDQGAVNDLFDVSDFSDESRTAKEFLPVVPEGVYLSSPPANFSHSGSEQSGMVNGSGGNLTNSWLQRQDVYRNVSGGAGTQLGSRWKDERRWVLQANPVGYLVESLNTTSPDYRNLRVGSDEYTYREHGSRNRLTLINDPDLYEIAADSPIVENPQDCFDPEPSFIGFIKADEEGRIWGKCENFSDNRRSKAYTAEMPLESVTISTTSAYYFSQSPEPNSLQIRQNRSDIGETPPTPPQYSKTLQSDAVFAPTILGKYTTNCIFQAHILIEGKYSRNLDGVLPEFPILSSHYDGFFYWLPYAIPSWFYGATYRAGHYYCENYTAFLDCEWLDPPSGFQFFPAITMIPNSPTITVGNELAEEEIILSTAGYNQDDTLIRQPRIVHCQATADITTELDPEGGVDLLESPFLRARDSGLEDAIKLLIEGYYTEYGYPEEDVHLGFAGPDSAFGEGIIVEIYE
jgi:hypothetical protein